MKRNRANAWLLATAVAVLGLGEISALQEERGIRPVRAPDGEPPKGKNWLVLVAISDYKYMKSLEGPRNEAAALKEVLTTQYTFTEQYIRELYDDNATKRGIQSLLRQIGESVGENDSVLIYYAGHGATDEFSGTGYWIPSDGGVDPVEKSHWLPNEEIRGSIRALRAKHVLLVADSCFSGDLLARGRDTAPVVDDDYFRRAYSLVSRQVLTSGSSEPVIDVELNGMSAFAFHLVDTLRRNRAAYVDPHALFVSLRAGVAKTQHPLLGELDGAGHQRGGSYLFFHVAPDFLSDMSTTVVPPVINSEGPTPHDELEWQSGRMIRKKDQMEMVAVPFDSDQLLMDVHEITVEMYLKVVGSLPRDQQGTAVHPVVSVTWREADEYCRLVGAMLPDLEDWNEAARGGLTDPRFPWGDQDVCAGAECRANFCDRNCPWRPREKASNDLFPKTAPVCSFDKNGFGLCDVSGNVWEWIAAEADSKRRTSVGGSWGSQPSDLTLTSRYRRGAGTRENNIGFRCSIRLD